VHDGVYLLLSCTEIIRFLFAPGLKDRWGMRYCLIVTIVGCRSMIVLCTEPGMFDDACAYLKMVKNTESHDHPLLDEGKFMSLSLTCCCIVWNYQYRPTEPLDTLDVEAVPACGSEELARVDQTDKQGDASEVVINGRN
jgi:hypothetical protein